MPMDHLLLALVLVGLATASTSRLVTSEDGYRDVFKRFRRRFAPDSQAGKIVRCPICFGVWACGLYSAWAGLAVALCPPLLFVLLPPAALGIAYAALGMGALWGGAPPEPDDGTSNGLQG